MARRGKTTGKIPKVGDWLPLNYQKIFKGKTLNDSDMVESTNISHLHNDFWTIKLRFNIMLSDYWLIRGEIVTTKIVDGGIYVLTDAEASELNEKRAERDSRKVITHIMRLFAVDEGKLTKRINEKHQERLKHCLKLARAMREADPTLPDSLQPVQSMLQFTQPKPIKSKTKTNGKKHNATRSVSAKG